MKLRKLIAGSLVLSFSLLNAQVMDLKPGWQLLGATEDMSTKAFDDSGCVDFVWKYTDQKWQLHIANGKKYKYDGPTFDTLKKWEGFWVKASKECQVDTNTTQNNDNDNNNNQNGNSEEVSKALTRINEIRHEVFQDNDMQWDDSLAQAAQAYADKLAKSGEFKHDPENRTKGYGENLYASSSSGVTFVDAINSWYEEKQNYHYDTNSCDSGKVCGHYTQLVWKNSTKVGCAKAVYETGKYKDGTVVVCKFKPAGNVSGQKPY